MGKAEIAEDTRPRWRDCRNGTWLAGMAMNSATGKSIFDDALFDAPPPDAWRRTKLNTARDQAPQFAEANASLNLELNPLLKRVVLQTYDFELVATPAPAKRLPEACKPSCHFPFRLGHA